MEDTSRLTTRIDQHGIATVTLGNPDRGLMDEAMEHALEDAVASLESDPSVRVVILTGGQPGVFVRHYDVAVLAERARMMADRGMEFDLSRTVPASAIHRALAAIESSPRIWIAAINGTAMGGGFELTLACDFRLVQAGPYRLGLPEVNLALLPGAGGTQRLTRLVGESRALALTLLGDTMTPEDAVQYGIALNQVEDDVLSAARDLARGLAARPADALAAIKHLVRHASRKPVEEGMGEERTLFCARMVSEEARAAMAQWCDGHREITDRP